VYSIVAPCLVVNGTEQAQPTANARLDRLFGAEIRHVSSRDERAPAMEQAAADLRAAGHRPFVVPLGASTATGALGFARGVAELSASGIKPDVILHASSSGGTQAGLIAGCALLGLRANVIGISADESSESLRGIVSGLLDGMAERLGAKRETIVGGRQIDVDDSQVGGGYGVPHLRPVEAVVDEAQRGRDHAGDRVEIGRTEKRRHGLRHRRGAAAPRAIGLRPGRTD
jgi:1-aminocyclopropane-1-carboxylate deaminase/D-cysteine desulfhydrase-like pyridoxal-dependent ACC family enzyme